MELKKRDINQINKRIDDGEANIYTAEEFKKLIKEDNAPSFDDHMVTSCVKI